MSKCCAASLDNGFYVLFIFIWSNSHVCRSNPKHVSRRGKELPISFISLAKMLIKWKFFIFNSIWQHVVREMYVGRQNFGFICSDFLLLNRRVWTSLTGDSPAWSPRPGPARLQGPSVRNDQGPVKSTVERFLTNKGKSVGAFVGSSNWEKRHK